MSLDLTELAVEFGTDKWGVHRYTPHYQRHLEHLRGEKFTLLEIGIGGYARKRRSGASLKMWRWFFPQARIVGLDIEDKSFLDGGHVATYLGDQTDPAILQRIVEEQGAPLRRDRRRQPHPRARPGDLRHPVPAACRTARSTASRTSRRPTGRRGAEPSTRRRRAPRWTWSRTSSTVSTTRSSSSTGYEPSYTDTPRPKAVHCYHNLVVIEKGDNVEGSNRDTAAHTFHGSNDDPAPTNSPETT